MYVCVKCRKEMRCDKTGVGVDFGNGHVYAGDRYKCPACGNEVVATNSNPYFDPEYKFKDEYLHMSCPG